MVALQVMIVGDVVNLLLVVVYISNLNSNHGLCYVAI